MANSKLSNIYELDRMVKGIPSKIEAHTKDLIEDVSTVKEKSLYYSEMSFLGMFTCILICIIGVSIFIMQDFISGFISFDESLLNKYNTMIKIVGGFLLIVGINGLGKMMFALKISLCIKRISKIEDSFKTKLDSSLEKLSVSQMIDMIENNKDNEIPETDSLDNKLINPVKALFYRNKLMNRVTLILRIAIPIVIYFITLYVIFKSENLGITSTTAITVAFVLMIVFSRRLGLLLEYKVGKAVRAIMTIPAIVYGVVLYFKSKDIFLGKSFLPNNLLEKLPEEAQPFVSSIFFVCVLQVIVLILSVLFQDYYSEKKRLLKGISNNENKVSKKKKYYIYYSIAFHIFLFAVYIIAMIAKMKELQELNSIRNTLITGAVFGVIWRVISPIWPETIAKTIKKFWGARYSFVVSAFIFVIITTLFFLNGFVFTLYALIAMITMIVSSWIAFAVMVHFWN